jgi:2-polyprenyl-3-methyl-5-hydroxy-6-metoxy-1,4-benzoquinol methylase
MTCSHCCGAEKIFDDKEAQKKLKGYRKKGPAKTSKRLLMAMNHEEVIDKSLLDIGGGVGAIQQELFARGLKSSTAVDASKSYIDAARELGKEKLTEERMTFIYGDYLDIYKNVETHEFVTLEKVVCCYPNMETLIQESTSKSKGIYGLVYPIDNWFSRSINKMGRLVFKFRKTPFRTFIHSEKKMDSLIQSNGFERIHHSTVFPWKVAVYKRIDA